MSLTREDVRSLHDLAVVIYEGSVGVERDAAVRIAVLLAARYGQMYIPPVMREDYFKCMKEQEMVDRTARNCK